ncbi:MAG: hypothetical protein P8176_06925 [Gammaproteobacteria bacterium]
MIDSTGGGSKGVFDTILGAGAGDSSSTGSSTNGSASASAFDALSQGSPNSDSGVSNSNQDVFNLLLADTPGSRSSSLFGGDWSGGNTKSTSDSKQTAESMMAKADQDGDGLISAEELNALDPETQAAIKEMGGLDAIAGIDGKLDVDELSMVLEKVSGGSSSRAGDAASTQENLLGGLSKFLEGVMSGDAKLMQEGIKEMSSAIDGLSGAKSGALPEASPSTTPDPVPTENAGSRAGVNVNPNIGRIKFF